MEQLALVGLSPQLVAAVRAEAAKSPSISLDVLELSGIHAASSAALLAMSVDCWTTFLDNVKASDRPPVYLVCGEILDVQELADWSKAEVAGFGPAMFPGLAADIVALCRRFCRDSEDLGLTVGGRVRLSSSLSPTDSPLIGWGVGTGAEVRRALRSAAGELVLSTTDNPFEKVNPRELLDVYSFLNFGAVLENFSDEQRKAFGKRTGMKNLPDDLNGFFKTHFLNSEIRAPRKPTLLLGETGTGKTLVARQLHRQLEAKMGRPLPFHHVNCSTLREMAEVELFGAMRGAFTSADVTNPGKIIASYGGTIFLDELATLSAGAQARLLVFLQDSTVTPMGWLGDALHVPAQVIAATNEHLAARAGAGGFRADLFYRFGRTLTLPPLREVKHDLPYLVDYLLQQESVNPSAQVQGMSELALQKLEGHDYPGNVRELETVLTRAVGLARQANVQAITSSDIVFDETTLPLSDQVLALVVPSDGSRRLLLLWSVSWSTWFVPTRPIDYGTLESSLEEELRERVGLELADYTATSMADIGTLRLIQFGRRDLRMKHYSFHPFRVEVSADVAEKLARRSTVHWVELNSDGSLHDAPRPLSETLLSPPFKRVLRSLACWPEPVAT